MHLTPVPSATTFNGLSGAATTIPANIVHCRGGCGFPRFGSLSYWAITRRATSSALGMSAHPSKCRLHNALFGPRSRVVWGTSSHGRALASHARGTGIDTLVLHIFFFIARRYNTASFWVILPCMCVQHCSSCIQTPISPGIPTSNPSKLSIFVKAIQNRVRALAANGQWTTVHVAIFLVVEVTRAGRQTHFAGWPISP